MQMHVSLLYGNVILYAEGIANVYSMFECWRTTPKDINNAHVLADPETETLFIELKMFLFGPTYRRCR